MLNAHLEVNGFLHPDFDGLPQLIRTALLDLSEEPALPLAGLSRQVRAYRTHLAAVGPRLPAVNVALAEVLAEACLALLEELHEDLPESERRVAQIAVRYFVEADDGDEDLTSPSGLEDDRLVFNAAASALGCPHLIVSPA